jgi:hypothetical protein
MASLAEFRQQHPEYNDMSDDALADSLHKKFYSDIPPSAFRQSLGLERKSYDASEVPGAVADNAYESARRVKKAVVGAASDPVKFVKDVAKTAIGAGQKIVGGVKGELGYGPEIDSPDYKPYEYEKSHADPMLQGMLGDWGWKEPTWEGQYEQIKRNVAEKPVEAGMDVAAAGSLVPGVAGRTMRALNVPYQAARQIATPLLPIRARPGFAEARDTLRHHGVSLTAGQATGSAAMKRAEQQLGGARTTARTDTQLEEFSRAGSAMIGENTPNLNPAARNGARARIGGEFNALGARNPIPPDPQLAIDLQRATQAYVASVPVAAPGIAQVAQGIAQRGAAGLTGNQYTSFRSGLSRRQRNTHDPQMQAAYHDMIEALDGAMERQLQRTGNQADMAAFANARGQWRNLIVLDNAMATGGVNTARWLLTPERLEAAAAAGPNRTWYTRGISDFTELAKAGRVGMSPMPDSGTAANWVTQAIPAAMGAAVGGGGWGPVGAAVGAIGGRMAAGRAIMSPVAQRYYQTQIPGRTAIGRGANAATALTPRIQAIQDAEKVLGPDMMREAKKSSPKELNAWVSTQPRSGSRLS